MTTKSVADVLHNLDKYLHAVDSPAAGGLAPIADWLLSRAEARLELLLNKLSGLQVPANTESGGALVREILPALDGGFLARLRKKQGDGDSKDLGRLAEFLRPFSGLSINAVVAACQTKLAERLLPQPTQRARSNALRQELVDKYLVRLKASLGRDAEFNRVFEELDEDRKVRQLEMLAIANLLLTYPPKAKAGRKDLLNEIRTLHRAGASFDRHLRATAGRTAG